jgi:deoxycytidine triphosphate deaminase
MYLSDKELKKRLYESNESQKLIIAPSSADDLKSIDQQIGSCSIDLKLSPLYWIQKQSVFKIKKIIDLADNFCDAQIHSKYWIEKSLSTDGYVLKPGHCILGKIDEEIRIPLDCLGKIEARSGMNRLLLVITLGDFISPGYKGNYPLQIINMSKYRIKIYPKMSVCQLLLSELTSLPEKSYSEVSNTYYADDGGPACWWSDRQLNLFMKDSVGEEKKTYERIRKICEKHDIILHITEILSRYKLFYKKSKQHNENLKKSVDKFIDKEIKKNKKNTLLIKIIKSCRISISSLASIGALIGIISGFLQVYTNHSTNLSIKQIIFWVICFVVVIILINFLLVILIHNLEKRNYLKWSE